MRDLYNLLRRWYCFFFTHLIGLKIISSVGVSFILLPFNSYILYVYVCVYYLCMSVRVLCVYMHVCVCLYTTTKIIIINNIQKTKIPCNSVNNFFFTFIYVNGIVKIKTYKIKHRRVYCIYIYVYSSRV